MLISGTEPSSVILSQRSSLKSWKCMPKQGKAKRDGVINPQKQDKSSELQFQEF